MRHHYEPGKAEKKTETLISGKIMLSLHSQQHPDISQSALIMDIHLQQVETTTITKKISRTAIQKKWGPINVAASNQLKEILETHVEPAIHSSKGPKSTKSQSAQRRALRKLIRALNERISTFKVPPASSAKQFDLEHLNQRNRRIGLNLNANLRQVKLLERQLLKESKSLQGDRVFYERLKASMKQNYQLMEKDTGEVLKPRSTSVTQPSEYSVSFQDVSRGKYRPSEDPQLAQSLSVLSRHLHSIEKNTGKLGILAGKCDTVNTLVKRLLSTGRDEDGQR